MPPFEDMDRHDPVVYWSKAGVDRYNRPQLASPVELAVRWIDEQREVPQPNGTTATSTVTITLGQDVALGDIFWKGGLADLPGTAQTPEADAMQVVGRRVVPDIKRRNVSYMAFLMKYADTLPELATP